MEDDFDCPICPTEYERLTYEIEVAYRAMAAFAPGSDERISILKRIAALKAERRRYDR